MCIDTALAVGPTQALGRSPLRVLLVVDEAERRHELIALLERLAPGCQIVSDDDTVDALLTAARLHADLVVVAWAQGHEAASVLRRHLGRVAPGACVLVIEPPPATAVSPVAPPFADAESALARWLGRRADARPAVRPEAAVVPS